MDFNFGLTNRLSRAELETMRSMNQNWNKFSAENSKNPKVVNFVFNTVEDLQQFNSTYANCSPLDDFASSKFSFMLPVLSARAASTHLNGFLKTFGTVVTSLTLSFGNPDNSGPSWWRNPEEKETVRNTVTALLCKVKGQLQVLELKYYAGLPSSVIGSSPFPVLKSLSIVNHYSVDHARGTVAAAAEACILELSQRVPAIQRFEFDSYRLVRIEDTSYLPNVLRNLLRANPEVDVTLGLGGSPAQCDVARVLLEGLGTVPVRIRELSFSVNTRGKPEMLRSILKWIGDQRDCLKKLSLMDAGESSHAAGDRTGLVLPSMRVLEELAYIQWSEVSLLQYNSADYFPALRSVSTVYSGNDFLVPLPSVNHVTLLHVPFSFQTARSDFDIERFFLFQPFPNLRSLAVPESFLKVRNLYKLPLTRLTVMRNEWNNDDAEFWDIVTQDAQKLTFDQIKTLPVCAQAQIARNQNGLVVPILRDIGNLEELVIRGGRQAGITIAKLEAILYISKNKTLQRLQKLVIERSREEVREGPTIPECYLEELRKYHACVEVTDEIPGTVW